MNRGVTALIIFAGLGVWRALNNRVGGNMPKAAETKVEEREEEEVVVVEPQLSVELQPLTERHLGEGVSFRLVNLDTTTEGDLLTITKISTRTDGVIIYNVVTEAGIPQIITSTDLTNFAARGFVINAL